MNPGKAEEATEGTGAPAAASAASSRVIGDIDSNLYLTDCYEKSIEIWEKNYLQSLAEGT